MIAGDLDTFSLPDLLQWADMSRARGVLVVEREGVPVWLRLEGRQVREISRAPASSRALHELSERAAGTSWLRLPEDTEATERALDLFLEPGGRFRFADDVSPDDGVPVALELRELVFEGMRHLDEWQRLSITYPDEGARLTATGAAAESTLLPVARVILRAAALSLSLGEVRLALRLSRPAILRRVHELVSLGLVTVEGSKGGADPVARLVAQSESLAREGQYEEAAHVLRAILESDPSDHRVAGILGDVERRHREALEAQIDPAAVVILTDPAARAAPRLSDADREVVDRVDGRRDVKSILLASPHRELETLKTLAKLVKLGLAVLELPGDTEAP